MRQLHVIGAVREHPRSFSSTRRLVEHDLVAADAQRYRRAALRLARMRRLAAATDASVEIDELVAARRETHRRRPRLQQELDRAGLP